MIRTKADQNLRTDLTFLERIVISWFPIAIRVSRTSRASSGMELAGFWKFALGTGHVQPPEPPATAIFTMLIDDSVYVLPVKGEAW